MTLDEMENLWLARFGAVFDYDEMSAQVFNEETLPFWKNIFDALLEAKRLQSSVFKRKYFLTNHL